MSDQSALKRSFRWRESLSFRLFLIAIASVLVVEALIFIPSATNFRNNWLNDQIEAGRLAALALEAAPSRMVSEELEQDLLESAMVLAVAELYDERRDMILNPGEDICCTRKIILYDDSPDFSEAGCRAGSRCGHRVRRRASLRRRVPGRRNAVFGDVNR